MSFSFPQTPWLLLRACWREERGRERDARCAGGEGPRKRILGNLGHRISSVGLYISVSVTPSPGLLFALDFYPRHIDNILG